MTKKTKSKKKVAGQTQAEQQKPAAPQIQEVSQQIPQKPVPNVCPVILAKPQRAADIKENQSVTPKVPEVSIIPIGLSTAPAPSSESAASGKKKKKRNKKKGGQQQAGDTSEALPAVTVIPLNKDPGTIPAHLNPAVVLARQTESKGPKVIEASPVVTLIGSNKKAQGHGALYNPPPVPQVPHAPEEETVPDDKRQTISGGFKFPSSLQPVFEAPESIAVSTGVVLDTETSGVLTIVPVRQDGVKKRRNRNKVLPPCCELRGTSGLEVVCPHSNKPILNYNTIVNEDVEFSRQLQETQESLQQIEDPEVLGSLANIGHSVTIKLIGGGGTEKTVHDSTTRPETESQTIVVEAADAMSKENTEKTTPVTNGVKSGDAEKARLKAERRAAFEAKRAAEMAAAGPEKENKKEMTKAERRAIQEAQRAKKTQEKTGPAGDKLAATKETPALKSASNSESPPKQEMSSAEKKKDMPSKKVSFADMKFAANPFVNMHKRRDNIDNLLRSADRRKKDDTDKRTLIHPAILQLGFQIAAGAVSGANDRCVYMLEALKKLAQEFGATESTEVHDSRELSQEFFSKMDFNVAFLKECRPLSVSMTNALRHIKMSMSEDESMKNASQLSQTIIDNIDGFLQNEITLARRAIVEIAKSKINDGDVVLTYSRSSVVLDILTTCHEEGKRFSVVVVDARPALKGRETLKTLCQKGIHCKYVFIHSVSYIMKEVTKVLLGADTLLANGYVASRVGSSQISMIAHKMNVPVLVCCETYKFSDKVLADCFAGNELGSQREFLQNLSEKRKQLLCTTLSSTVSLVDLTYDITPPDFVTMVVTERGTLPCTSVPVVLRVRQNII